MLEHPETVVVVFGKQYPIVQFLDAHIEADVQVQPVGFEVLVELQFDVVIVYEQSPPTQEYPF